MLGYLFLSQAKVFQINPIPNSFQTLYDKAVADGTDKYFHWCGKISGNLLPDPAVKELKENEFQWFGDYTGHLSQKGGDRRYQRLKVGFLI